VLDVKQFQKLQQAQLALLQLLLTLLVPLTRCSTPRWLAATDVSVQCHFELSSFFAWRKNCAFNRKRKGTVVGNTQMPLHIWLWHW